MKCRRIILLTLAVIMCASGAGWAAQTAKQTQDRLQQLWAVYEDDAASASRRAQTLEEIISSYQNLLKQVAEKSATVRKILDGEVQWRLDLAKALVVERTRQGRFALEELGLRGQWAQDLGRTLDRTEQSLKVADSRLQQVIRHMRADARFERNYVVTGLYLRASRAQATLDYYWGMVHFYRALTSESAEERQEMLATAIESLRACCTGDAAELKGQAGRDQQQAQLRGQAVLLMVKALRLSNRFQEAQKLLSWLEGQALGDELAYEAGLQRCRLLRDRGRQETALAGLEQLRTWCARKKMIKQLPVRLTLAYLQCTIHAAKAKDALGSGDIAAGRESSRERLEPLEEIFRAEQSEQIRRIIYEQIRRTGLAEDQPADVAALEQLAIGVELAQAGKTAQSLQLFDTLLNQAEPAGDELRAEALWQAGLAGSTSFGLRSSNYFGRLADEFEDSKRANQATVLAVNAAAEVRADKPDDLQAEEACFAALKRLMSKYPAGKQADKWRLYWAELLLNRGQFTEAVGQFSQISKSDERFVRGRYYQLESRRRLLEDASTDLVAENEAEFARLAKDFLALDRYVLDSNSPAQHREQDSRRFGGMARLAAARVFCVQLDEPQTSLLVLGTFSADYAEQKQLTVTAKRYRIAAVTKLDRLNEAGQLALDLLDDEQPGAADVLDALLPRIRDKLGKDMPGDFSAEDRILAQKWVKLAQARVGLTGAKEQALSTAAPQMLARALFAAGRLDEALAIFEGLAKDNPDSADCIGMLGRVFLARKEYEKAGQQWVRLIRGLPGNSPEWFDAWYWALRTNAEADVDPAKLIRRIKQLQALDGQMGSPKTRVRFEEMLKKLEG